MTDRCKMLANLLEKATLSGYGAYDFPGGCTLESDGDGILVCTYKEGKARICVPVYLKEILFDHAFAKAFWGERRDITHYKFFLDGLYHDNVSVEEYDETQQDEHEREWERYEPVYRHQGWQYHLQQAVLSEDPLLYYFERL